MKLLSLVGSPRKGRNTDTLVDAAGKGFAGAGGSAEKVYVGDLSIGPCTGCYACMKDLDSICAQEDDMSQIYAKLLEADVLLWGTPVYMWSPTAQMKLFLDRLFPFGDYQTTRWRCALKGKPVGLVIVYADPDPLSSGIFHTHAILDIVARASGGTVAGTLHSAVSDEDEFADEHPLVARATELGADLAEAAQGGGGSRAVDVWAASAGGLWRQLAQGVGPTDRNSRFGRRTTRRRLHSPPRT